MVDQQFSRDVVMDGVRGREEHLISGTVAGIFAALVGAGLWMGVAVVSGMHIGYVALAVGAIVGLTVRQVGNGTGMIFGIIGAVLTLGGCLGGEILSVAQLASSAQRDVFHTLLTLDLSQTVANIFSRYQNNPIMYLIYAVGIFEGYKLSIRK